MAKNTGDTSRQLHAFGAYGNEEGEDPEYSLERDSREGIISKGHSGGSYYIGFHYNIPGTERVEVGREGLSREEYDEIKGIIEEHGEVRVRLPSRTILITDPKKLLEGENEQE